MKVDVWPVVVDAAWTVLEPFSALQATVAFSIVKGWLSIVAEKDPEAADAEPADEAADELLVDGPEELPPQALSPRARAVARAVAEMVLVL